jgi:histone H3/H4
MSNKLPHSTVKRLLVGDTGLRANGAAVEAFSYRILEFAANESKRIAEEVTNKRRKTIYDHDVKPQIAETVEAEKEESAEVEDEATDESLD